MTGTRANQFEWDEDKRSSTRVKHGIDFPDAIRIYDGGRCCMPHQNVRAKNDGSPQAS